MLRELHIKNFAIIDNVTIEFGKGLNALTGETGAGKSIIINALGLALGERATGDLIRSGAKEAIIEAFFEIPADTLSQSTRQYLQDTGIEIEDGLIFKRIISSQGRNRAYINTSMVNVQTLSDISRDVIDIHGQYEHQSLLSPEYQMELLDAYGGLLADREELKAAYEAYTSTRAQIAELLEKEKERSQRLDMLKFQINEIKAADLKIGEEEALTEEARILTSAVRLTELINRAYESLYSSDSSCITMLSGILDDLKEVTSIDSRVKDAASSIEEALPLLEETAYFLRDYKDGLDFSPERLEAVQERLELIRGLKRKYGDDIKAILDFKERAERELESLYHSEERLSGLRSRLEDLKKTLTEKAHLLSKKRKAISKRIESQIVQELSRLSMPDTRFSVKICHEKGDDTTDGYRVGPWGIDNIEFLISPNIGEDLRPLSRIASGGELSRIMLALKSILTKEDRTPVLVFDEIDAGIGGVAADAVGQRLKALSTTHQVICITHLPQIASYADVHLKIAKKVEGDRTVVEINRIEKDERTREIARMLSGNTSDASMRHAREMLRRKSRGS